MTTHDPSTPAARKSRGSREKILRVALREFSNRGLSGARVDRIASLAKTSKNMIYYHFKNKEGLYREVMKFAYADIRQNERSIDAESSRPVEALKELIETSFDYHCNNEMFIRLVMSENMNRAKHLQNTAEMSAQNKLIVEALTQILRRGQEQGIFRQDIDPLHLHLTISALNFHFVSNRYTFGKLFELDMISKPAIEQRREEIVDVVLRWCKQ